MPYASGNISHNKWSRDPSQEVRGEREFQNVVCCIVWNGLNQNWSLWQKFVVLPLSQPENIYSDEWSIQAHVEVVDSNWDGSECLQSSKVDPKDDWWMCIFGQAKMCTHIWRNSWNLKQFWWSHYSELTRNNCYALDYFYWFRQMWTEEDHNSNNRLQKKLDFQVKLFHEECEREHKNT